MVSLYRERRLGPLRFVRSSSLYFRSYGAGLSYALVLRDAPWHLKLRRIRGVRIGWAGRSYWLTVGDGS